MERQQVFARRGSWIYHQRARILERAVATKQSVGVLESYGPHGMAIAEHVEGEAVMVYVSSPFAWVINYSVLHSLGYFSLFGLR
jgi:hypothetical protein